MTMRRDTKQKKQEGACHWTVKLLVVLNRHEGEAEFVTATIEPLEPMPAGSPQAPKVNKRASNRKRPPSKGGKRRLAVVATEEEEVD
jgi:hypothetical protein